MPDDATLPSQPAVPLAARVPAGFRLLAALLVLLLTAGLFLGGAQPLAAGLFKSGWDKLAHAAVFACMGLAYGVASGHQGWRMLLWSVLGALAVGSMDELHQITLPGREPSWSDLLADGVGGLLGGLALHGIYQGIKQRRARLRGLASPAAKLQRRPGALA